jgi:hypothetical protein
MPRLRILYQFDARAMTLLAIGVDAISPCRAI